LEVRFLGLHDANRSNSSVRWTSVIGDILLPSIWIIKSCRRCFDYFQPLESKNRTDVVFFN
jgi:hypothetical protein